MARAAGWNATLTELLPRLKLTVLAVGGLGTTLVVLRALVRGVKAANERFVPARSRTLVTNVGWGLFVGTLVVLLVTAAYMSGAEQGAVLKSARMRATSVGAQGLESSFGTQSEKLRALSVESTRLLESLDRTGEMLEGARRDIRRVADVARTQLAAVDSAHSSIGDLVAREQALAAQAMELQRILGGRTPIVREDLDRASRASLVAGFVDGVLSSVAAAGIVVGFRTIGAKLRSFFRGRPL
jgi:hypothetical protein